MSFFVLPISSNLIFRLLIGNILFKVNMKDREFTERKLLDAVGSIIASDGSR